MNADPLENTLGGSGDELTRELIAHCKLSPDTVAHIRETMRSKRLGFADAALHLGVVTTDDIEQLIGRARGESARGSSGIVEQAIRRHATRDVTTTRHVGQVKPGPRLIIAHDPDGERSERIRALRTELLLLGQESAGANMMVMLSPGAAEGRSQLAAELAIAFAQLGRRTLLVDSDLRRPHLHTLFESDNSWGLAQSLAFNEPPALLGVVGLPQLSLLTAGPPAPNPSELLSGARLPALVSTWRDHYDFVLFDTPPISLFADALTVATVVGRALVLTRAGVSTHRDMKDMLRRLASSQARILGAVVNEF